MSDNSTIALPSVSAVIDRFERNALGVTSEAFVRYYRIADKGTKVRIRTLRTNAFKEAFRAGRMEAASRLFDVESHMSGSTEAPRIDPNVEVGTLVANYLEAVIRLMSGEATISGNPDNVDKLRKWDEEVISGLTDFRDNVLMENIPDFPDFDDNSVNLLTTVKIGRKGKENDIRDMVVEVFDNVASGTFLKVSDIRDRIAVNYPDKGVTGKWDGRIAAALFATKTPIEGILPVGGPNRLNSDIYTQTGKNGAQKA